MKYLLLLSGVVVFGLSSCEKDQNRKLLNAYFKYSVNGKETIIKDGSGLNNNIFECFFKGDTALYINVSELYEGAGFVVKSNNINDGTYTLDDANRGYYTSPQNRLRYITTESSTGTLTIKKSTFQAKTLLNTLEGQFSFQAIDTLSGKSFSIVNGSFLMERKD